MADQKQRVILTAEDQTKSAVDSANRNLDSVTASSNKASDAMTAQTAAAAQRLVVIGDKSAAQINRLVARVQQQTDRLTLTPIEKLEADRARSLKSVGGLVEAQNKINAAYDRQLVFLQKTAAASTATADTVTKNAGRQTSATMAAADSVDRVRTSTDRARASLDQAGTGQGLTRVAAQASTAEASIDRLARKTRDAADVLSSFGQSLTIGVTTPLALAGKEAFDIAARYDAIDKSLSSILGNSTLAKLQQGELRTLSREPGLTFEGATGGFRRIVAAKKDIDLATAAIKEFGNALALAGGTEEDLQGITLALTQILSKAKVSAEEINQIAERIPATRTLIQQAFGTADSEAIVKKGITPDVFVKGIVEQAKLLPRAAASLQSEFKNIREDIRQTLAIIGKDLAEVLIPIFKSVSSTVRSAALAFADLPAAVRKAVVVFGLLAATLGPLALAIGGVVRVVSTVAQGYSLATAALARSTAVQVANTAATVAQARAYDGLAAAAGRAGVAESLAGVPGALTGRSAGAVRAAEGAADIAAARAAAATKFQAKKTAEAAAERAAIQAANPGGLFSYTAVSGGKFGTTATRAAGAAAETASLTRMNAALTESILKQNALNGAAEASSVRLIATNRTLLGLVDAATKAGASFNTLRVAGAAFIAIPLIGVLQGVGQSLDRLFDRSKPQWVDDVGGLANIIGAVGREYRDLAKSLAAPGLRAFGGVVDTVEGSVSQLSASYQDFVDKVSRKIDDSGFLAPFKELIDAGKRRLVGEKLAEDSLKRQQGFMANAAREAAAAAGAYEKRGAIEEKITEEATKAAARRAELTRDLRAELVRSTGEALRAGREISEVERIAADRAQERANLLEKEGAIVGRLQKRLFDLATTQKLLEAQRKDAYQGMQEAERFRDAAVERELTGTAKIAEQRRQAVAALDKRSLSPADRAKALGLIDAGVVALEGKLENDLVKQAQTFYKESARTAAEGFDKIEEERTAWLEKVKESPAAIAKVNEAIAALERRLTRDLAAEMQNRIDQRSLKGLEASKDTELRNIELRQARELEIETTFGRENMNRRIKTAMETLAIEEEFANRRLAVEEDLIRRRADIAINDATTAAQKEAIYQRSKQDIEDARQGRQIDIDRQRQQTAIKLEDVVRAENQKTFDRFKNAYDDLFDAIVSRSKSVGDVLKGIAKSVLLTPLKEITGNIFAAEATKIFGVPRGAAGGRLSTKLDLPGRLGDVVLRNGGAVPVTIENLPQQTSQSQASTGPSGLGGLLGGGLGGLLGGGFGGFRTPPFVPGGATSTSIDFGGGSIPLGGSTVPGTGGAGGSGGIAGQFSNYFSGLKGVLSKLGNLGQKAGSAGPGVGGAAGGALLIGGATLAIDGLRRGGLKGLAETAAGGALIGAKFGGPIGALIGGAIGAAAGGVRLLFKGGDEKIIEKVKSVYGVTIDKKFASDPIGKIIKSNYGGNLDVGVRSPEVRDLVNLYARSTGQQNGLVNQAFGVGLSQSGGSLTQTAARVDGVNVAYSGGALATSGPVDRLVTSTVANSTGQAQTINVASLVLSVNGTSAADALSGAVVRNPQAVAAASVEASRRSIGRRELTSLNTTPGLIV